MHDDSSHFGNYSCPGLGTAGCQDPRPEPEVRHKVLFAGFEVNLFAADPLLAKPIQMNFDPAGPAVGGFSEIYPQIKPGEKANDKIIILEDTTGTGKADKTTIFADGLFIPTGVEPGDGGAYVANSTELLHFEEPGRQSRSKAHRALRLRHRRYSPHHPHFPLGTGRLLYFNQSVYIHQPHRDAEGVAGSTAAASGVPAETGTRSLCPRSGIHGAIISTTGASPSSPMVPVAKGSTTAFPGAVLSRPRPGPHPRRPQPRQPKHCGLEIISGRHLPDDWQGDCITNDFRGHRVCRFIHRRWAAFLREQPEVIKTNHPAFRPIDVKMGPDGAIYIADWYNPIIQHGEVDFRDPRRDKTHGRIWRVTAKGRPLVTVPDSDHCDYQRTLKPFEGTRGLDAAQHQASDQRARRGTGSSTLQVW